MTPSVREDVATFCAPQVAEGDGWWRWHVPARALPAQVVNHPDRLVAHTRPVVIRVGFEVDYRALVERLQEQGRRVLLEYDDVTDVEPGMVTNSFVVFSVEGTTDEQLVGSIKAAARIADGLIVTTRELAEWWSAQGVARVFVCRNAVDPAEWPTTIRRRADDVFRVGFAGGFTHMHDVSLICDALRWARAQPGVEVHFFGFSPRGWTLSEQAAVYEGDAAARAAARSAFHARRAQWNFPVREHSYVPTIGEHVKNICTLDVGLAPILPTTTFGRCRSDTKLLEYAMGGALPIVSDVEPYHEWRGRVPMAASAEEFTEHVCWAVENRDEARALAAEIRAEVLERRSIHATIGEWRTALALT